MLIELFCSFLIYSTQTRARLSFKRRLPTRQHRRSAGEEAGAFGSSLSPHELYSSHQNGDQDQAVNSPAEEDQYKQLGGLKEAEEKEDCEKAEDKEGKSDPDDETDPEEEEQTSEQAQSSDALETEQPPEICPVEQIEGDVKAEEEQEEMSQEEHQGGNDEAWTPNVYIRQKKTKQYLNKLFITSIKKILLRDSFFVLMFLAYVLFIIVVSPGCSNRSLNTGVMRNIFFYITWYLFIWQVKYVNRALPGFVT